MRLDRVAKDGGHEAAPQIGISLAGDRHLLHGAVGLTPKVSHFSRPSGMGLRIDNAARDSK